MPPSKGPLSLGREPYTDAAAMMCPGLATLKLAVQVSDRCLNHLGMWCPRRDKEADFSQAKGSALTSLWDPRCCRMICKQLPQANAKQMILTMASKG